MSLTAGFITSWDKFFEIQILKLHCEKSLISTERSMFLALVSLPSLKSEVDIVKTVNSRGWLSGIGLFV